MGPFQVYGLRSDDPNDLTPHEHRRDLRGLFVFAAWLDHVYMTANSTLDVMVEENNVPFIRHYLIDFVATLGSGAGGRRPKIVWEGNELAYDRGSTLKNIAGLGVWSPNWMRAKYPSIGRFEYKTFEPDKWVTDAEIAPFANRLPDDTYWAAKRVMAFSNDDIRALVQHGRIQRLRGGSMAGRVPHRTTQQDRKDVLLRGLAARWVRSGRRRAQVRRPRRPLRLHRASQLSSSVVDLRKQDGEAYQPGRLGLDLRDPPIHRNRGGWIALRSEDLGGRSTDGGDRVLS